MIAPAFKLNPKPVGPEPWPEPQPLAVRVPAAPYPIDALPETMRAAVEEVQGFVKAPVPLVAASALGAASVAVQAQIDVQRADRLSGPVSLYFLSVADSGERKTTVDGFFTAAIRDYEREQAEAMAPEIIRHEAALAAWTAKREGLLNAIRGAKQKGKDSGSMERDLVNLQAERPEAPRVPRLLLGDSTPEALAWSLARSWPAAGVLSSEAGLIFGAHGMGKDSAMRNLALLNILWDGGTHSVDRRTSDSFTVRGARLTMGLQIQEPTLAAFFDRSGGLARGTGFLARFLMAWPESTQGFRPFTEAPAHWPHLAAFHDRVKRLLNVPAPLEDDGTLRPLLLTLAPDARAAWVAFHDAIEAELRDGGELFDVRDVAAKTADNAARLAAVFHAFESGTHAPVSLEAFVGASRIAAWHLNEARRFFGELALPVELADAGRLDTWLLRHCMETREGQTNKNYVRRYGPLRDGPRLSAAIRELEELDRLRLVEEGRRKHLEVNPRLLETAP
jgi:putative DNA primase/helicase